MLAARPITESWLARRLRSFGIQSKNIRLGTMQAKGYEVADFYDGFTRYLPHLDPSKRPSVPSQQISRFDDAPNHPEEFFGTDSSRPLQEPWDGLKEYESGMNIGLGRWDGIEDEIKERAAIMEFDGGFTREEAERLARLNSSLASIN